MADSEGEWEVKCILKRRTTRKKGVEYQVDWEPVDGQTWPPSWEPAANIHTEMVAEFEADRKKAAAEKKRAYNAKRKAKVPTGVSLCEFPFKRQRFPPLSTGVGMSLSYSAFSNRQLPPLPTSSSGYFLPPRQTTQSVSQSSHDSSVYQSSSHSGLSSNEHPGTQSPFVNQRLHIVPENSHALADFQQTSELYASFQPPPVNSYMPSSFSNCYRPHVPSRPQKINSLR
eukprot:253721_1